jgi:predicted aldo/keto reductase-like oxidoreductase
MTDQKAIRANLEATLRKLRTDSIDVYLIHNIMPTSWPKIKERRIMAEYEQFKKEGLIKAIGFSYHGHAAGFKDVFTSYDWDMAQIQQNFIDVEKQATEKAFDLVAKKGAALVIMEPLRGGGLATPPPAVQALYAAHGVQRSPVDWAFRHLLDRPEVSCILSGVTTLEQLKDNIRIFSAPDALPGCLTAADKELIKKVRAAYESLASIPCTGCEYCMPCPQNVNIPRIFGSYNDGIMFTNFAQPKRSYLFVTAQKADATHCVACGACEKKCPQRINIIEQLQVAHKALEGWRE